MNATASTDETLRAENAELRARLAEAEEMLRAIRAGEVDALVVESSAGPQLFVLQGVVAEQNRMRGEMLAQVSDAVIATDLEERVTFLNATAERLYGIRARDVLGRAFAEIYIRHWPSPDAEAGMRTALRDRGEWRGELIHRTPDGREMHVEKVISALRDLDGAGIGYIASIRDITERKRMDQRLREEEHRLRLAMAAAATGMWDWDVATNQVVWTPECYLIHGLREGEFDGTAAAFDRLVHPDDRGRVWAAVTAAIERGTLYESEFRIVRPTGEVRWVSNKGRAISDGANVPRRMVGTITDITANKQAEAALRLANERFDLAVKCSQVVLFQQDLELRYTWLQNPAPGFDDFHAIGKRDTDLMERAADAAVTEALKREVIRTGVSQRQEVTVQIAGVGRHYDLLLEPLRDAAGLISGVTCAAIDITERKQAEEALARLAAIVESSHDALFSEDVDGIITSWNRGAEQIFGYTAEEIVGTSIMRLIPADRQAAEHELQRQLAAGERGGTFEAIRRTKDGREFPVSITISPLKDAAGKVSGTARVVRDITDRKVAEAARRANEERMRLATAATEVGIWERNVLTGSLRWDAQMFQIYGVAPTPDGFVSYDTWRGAVLPEDLARQEEVLLHTVRRCGKSTREFRILRADNGECRHIQAIETVRANEQGQAEWMVGTNLDVTEQKNAERAIREASEKAVAANAAKDRFLAALSHELRTPLTPVMLVAGVHAKSKKLSEDLREDFEMIHRNIVLEAQLIDDLLDVSRIQQGKMRFDFKIVDVHEAIARSLEMVRSEVEEKGIAVRQELGAAPATTEADSARLLQVLCNLLRNAVKFTPPGGTLTLRTARDPGALQISVADTGAGIAAEDLERIFQPFEQVDAQQKSEHRSLGLGLAISGAILAAHRGRIWAESPGPGQGATFHVRLPV